MLDNEHLTGWYRSGSADPSCGDGKCKLPIAGRTVPASGTGGGEREARIAIEQNPRNPGHIRTVDDGVGHPVNTCLLALRLSIGKALRFSIGNHGKNWLAGLTGPMEKVISPELLPTRRQSAPMHNRRARSPSA